MLFETFNKTQSANSQFSPVLGGNDRGTTEAIYSTIVPITCTMLRFRVRLSAALGGGNSITWTVRVNGSNTAMIVTIGGASDTEDEYVGSISVSPADIVSIGHVVTGSPTSKEIEYSFLWNSAARDESFLSGEITAIMQSGTFYLPLAGTSRTLETIEFNHESISPGTFTVKNLYVICTSAPGGLHTRTYTLRTNSGATSLTCAIAGAATSNSDLSHSATIAPGDAFTLQHIHTGFGRPTNTYTRYSVAIVANATGSVPDTFIVNSANRDNWTVATEYGTPQGAYPNHSSTISQQRQRTPYRTMMENIHAEVSVAAGALGTRNYTLYDGSDTVLTVGLANTVTKGSTTAHLTRPIKTDLAIKSNQVGGSPQTPVAHVSMLARVGRVKDIIQHGVIPFER